MPWLNVTNEQAELLRRVLDQFPQTAGNPRIRQDTERSYDDRQDFQAPEVYIALVPAAGIPALSASGTGVGAGDTPGSEECDIYQIVSGSLVAISGLNKTVYNLSDAEIAEGWITVIRDKFGKWIANVSGGGAVVDECEYGIDIAALLESTNPSYVIGVSAVGCLVKVPVLLCNQAATGTP